MGTNIQQVQKNVPRHILRGKMRIVTSELIYVYLEKK